MEKSNNYPWVAPESGPGMFRKMREQLASGDLPEEPRKTEKSSQADVLKIKKNEKVEKDTPIPASTPNFINGASAMDDWEKEKEAAEGKRWHKAA